MRIAVAIDGPAGAGKSTIARILAKKFNLMYINTGAMYRAVTLKAIEKNITSNEVDKLCELIDSMEMHFDCEDKLYVNNENVSEQIVTPFISNKVSQYASIREIRERLVQLMRKMSQKYDVVMDGRDIGTVVLKDAPYKFYLTASAEERAKRRYNELIAKGSKVEYSAILNDIIERDYVDTHREVDPLTKADDAFEIDSSTLSIEEVVEVMAKHIIL